MQRGSLRAHEKVMCPRAPVLCAAEDGGCRWTGPKLYNIPKYYLKGGRVNVNTFGQMWTMHVQLYGSWCLYACHSLFKNTVHPSRVVAMQGRARHARGDVRMG